MSTGSRIAQLRSRRQWSQTYFARKVGTNVNSVKDWENDDREKCEEAVFSFQGERRLSS